MLKAIRVFLCLAALSLPGTGFAAVYWGDLHVHTGYSADGNPTSTTPDTACYYAKQNGLNFTAVTDHAEPSGFAGKMTEALWNDSVAKMQSGNCSEGSNFIAFTGYEWGSGIYGHRSVIFKDLNIPWSSVFSSHAYPTPNALWNALETAGYHSSALTIPHHPAGAAPADINWDYHNPNFQPVVEVFSEHGNSEYCGADYEPLTKGCVSTGSVTYALGVKRFMLGMIAGTDAHDAQPGSVSGSYGGGLIAVIAPSLSRNDIWDAIKNRRTYATSGARIGVSLHINGYGMGLTAYVPVATDPTLTISAAGDGANITRIEIIKNGYGSAPQHTVYFDSSPVSLSWTDTDYVSGDFYYIRVIQADNERAWTSPIWVVTQ